MSTYVLAGVEAGMLTTRHFGALSTEQIQMHKDKTWGKINGWWAVSRRMLSAKKGDNPVLSPVWIALSALSVLSWVFALSGITTETRRTYQAGATSSPQAPITQFSSHPKQSDFKILSKRFNSRMPGYLDGTGRGPGTGDPTRSEKPPDHYFYEVPGLPNATISVLSPRPVTSRTETVAEVGLTSGIYNLLNSKTRTYGADPGGLDTEELLDAGWASLNGLDGTFHDFRREDPRSTLGSRSAHLPRLNAAVPAILLLGIRLRLVSDCSMLVGPAGMQGWQFPSVTASAPWLPPDTLDYKGVDLRETELGFLPEITTPLFTAGQVPFNANEYTERPCAEFALGCMVLGLVYSFRKRWDAFFTTRSLYWY
ncbi:hypothetical protein C7999DRAFT_30584 [Corynascus novoguineensis]|uniref:Uncharacterized protein n=1 Tax=Corynascus novoguineensis TaxID=1126955 RepID=A0AAN7CV55_9PEZI|nr:hypothetical protein C7999DRAFT_30584 [Corynascus novoguineensis]